jgi:hypothetical protein
MNRSCQIARFLRNQDLTVKELYLGIEGQCLRNPFVVIDHTSYPGVEAHLFTAAHAARWNVQFTDARDVLLSYPTINFEREEEVSPFQATLDAWSCLTSILSTLMNCLKVYKEDISHGEFATVVWGHHATEWHREMWDCKIHDYIPPSEFIDYVDLSIRSHITELNNLGFATLESCSGLIIDHPDRAPYKPYVMFDERSYIGSTPHFFTLGDMAGWESMYAPHGFDVYIRVINEDDIEDAWFRLMSSARILGPLLSVYRDSNKGMSSHQHDGGRIPAEGEIDETHHILDDKTRMIRRLSESQ